VQFNLVHPEKPGKVIQLKSDDALDAAGSLSLLGVTGMLPLMPIAFFGHVPGFILWAIYATTATASLGYCELREDGGLYQKPWDAHIRRKVARRIKHGWVAIPRGTQGIDLEAVKADLIAIERVRGKDPRILAHHTQVETLWSALVAHAGELALLDSERIRQEAEDVVSIEAGIKPIFTDDPNLERKAELQSNIHALTKEIAAQRAAVEALGSELQRSIEAKATLTEVRKVPLNKRPTLPDVQELLSRSETNREDSNNYLTALKELN
jgi:hypothetical protein